MEELIIQSFVVQKLYSPVYRISRTWIREEGPDYLFVCMPSPEEKNWIVDFQNEEEEVTGFETLGEAVGAVVQYMMGFETDGSN